MIFKGIHARGTPVPEYVKKGYIVGRQVYVRQFYNNKDILDCLTISECREQAGAELGQAQVGLCWADI